MDFKPTNINQDELNKQKQDWINQIDKSNPVNIFAYGSLMWNPSCNVKSQTKGTLIGYHRDFCLYSYMYRGNLQNLGLLLGVRNGENCDGMVLEISTENINSDLSCIWDREMITGAYIPILTDIQCENEIKRCWVFIANTNHNQWAGDLTVQQQAKLIATASGKLGTNIDYLLNTVNQLQNMKISDSKLEKLADLTKSI